MKKKIFLLYLILFATLFAISTANHWYLFAGITCLVMVICPSFILILNRLYKKTNHYQNQFADILKFQGKQAFLLDIPHNLDVVNLGSNQPKFAFDYSNLPIKGMNWAVGPQSLEYDFMILKKFHSFLRKGAYVIIPVCPLEMFLHKYKNMSNVTKYYDTFEVSLIPDYDKKQRITEYLYPLIFHPKRIRFLLKDIPKDCRKSLLKNPMDKIQIKADAQKWIEECWNREFNIDIYNMKALSPKNKKAINANVHLLSEMITFCQEREYKPIIIFLPVTKELGDKFSEEFIDKYIKTFVDQAVKNRKVPVYDYLKDSRFQDEKLYINSFFMNRHGAQYFTNIFIKENTEHIPS